MLHKGIFITGTDTGCGKTELTLAIMQKLQQQGYIITGMKPVASGGENIEGQIYNTDALRIQKASSISVPYDVVNPYVFIPPIAPHIAAMEAEQLIESKVIYSCFLELTHHADIVIVEGVGGWRVPLSNQLQVSDLPELLNIPVVLVIGLRLGCLNHGLLTAEAILARGYNMLGWIGNQLDSAMLRVEENIGTLVHKIDAPYLGYVPYSTSNTIDFSLDVSLIDWSQIMSNPPN